MMYGVGVIVLLILGWWFLRDKPEELEVVISKDIWQRIEWCNECHCTGTNVCPKCGEDVVFRTARKIYNTNTNDIFPDFIEWELKPCDSD